MVRKFTCEKMRVLLPTTSFFVRPTAPALDGVSVNVNVNVKGRKPNIAYIHHDGGNVEPLLTYSRGGRDGDDSTVCFRGRGGETLGEKDRSGIIFLPGFQSSMRGTKSQALFNYCLEASREFTALDYYGQGESRSNHDDRHFNFDTGSIPQNGTIGQWMDDVLTILDKVTRPDSKQILVGSSMGAWIMVLVAMNRAERIGGLVGIGAAPDFTKNLLRRQIDLSDELSKQMGEMGYCDIPTKYDDSGSYRIHQELLLEAERHYLLARGENSIKWEGYDFPVALIHGTDDTDVGWEYSEKLLQCIDCKDKKLILVDGGDHRLSSPSDIDLILKTIDDLIQLN